MLHVPFRRTAIGKRSFSCAAPTTWNSLPASVINCDTLSVFKSKLKTHIFNFVYSQLTCSASASEATALRRYTNVSLLLLSHWNSSLGFTTYATRVSIPTAEKCKWATDQRSWKFLGESLLAAQAIMLRLLLHISPWRVCRLTHWFCLNRCTEKRSPDKGPPNCFFFTRIFFANKVHIIGKYNSSRHNKYYMINWYFFVAVVY